MMQPVSYADLQRFTGHARQDYMQALIDGWGELQAAGINTPLRWCHFLSQISHETGGLRIVREYTGWTPAQVQRITGSRFARIRPAVLLAGKDPRKLANAVYGTHPALGNCEPGDGWEYRGGGFLQTTGRDNYRMMGEAIGVDLEGSPSLIEDPAVSLRCALSEWSKTDCSKFADHNYGRAIGNAINRGNPYSSKEPIGHADRQQWFKRAWALFGGGQPLPDEDTLHLGACGPKVKRMQGALRDLGYGVGDQDGVYGPTMARAVAAFKFDQRQYMGVELEAGDEIGPLTVAAVDTALPVLLNPERENATIADLKAKGSTETVAGIQMEATGSVLAGTGGLVALDKTGALEAATGLMGKVSLFHSTAVPAVKAISWAFEHFWWVILIIAGIYCWRSGYAVKLARLAAHRLGFNLAR